MMIISSYYTTLYEFCQLIILGLFVVYQQECVAINLLHSKKIHFCIKTATLSAWRLHGRRIAMRRLRKRSGRRIIHL